MSQSSDQPAILILGGGLAGSAAAILLARHGHHVTLVERDAAPRHKVCGEFLSAEALELLTTLGLDLQSHQAHPIHTVRLASSRYLAEARLPFPAQSLTRCCLDNLLLDAAQTAGATVLRGSTVESLSHTGQCWQASLSTAEVLTAPTAILATGKHDLRGHPRPRGKQDDLVALKMYWQLAPEQATTLDNAVELHLHPHGYFGLQPVETGTANLTALIRRKHLTRIGGWPGLLVEIKATNPHSAARLHGAIPLLAKPLALSAIPYGFVRRHALAPNLYAVGDQAAVVPSFTGDGMSIALYSGLAAAQAILAGEPATLFQPLLHAQLRHQVARATLLSQALVQPLLGSALTTTAHLWPEVLTAVASLTRLPATAVSSALATPFPATSGS